MKTPVKFISLFEENRFRGFMRLVDMDNEGRTTLIIPEGWKGDGFRRFSETLFDQQDKMRALKKRQVKLPLEDLGISNSMEYRFDSIDSSLESYISSLLFNEDLKHLMGSIGVIGKGVGETTDEAIVESVDKSEQNIRNEGAVIDYIPLESENLNEVAQGNTIKLAEEIGSIDKDAIEVIDFISRPETDYVNRDIAISSENYYDGMAREAGEDESNVEEVMLVTPIQVSFP
ncbi:unnamed protein product [Cuscuta europaea]|uniref:Uncharacterized protein n=1 Tax=Cuscuta europaea TaxID=41803 RepID=A0A9P1EM70_CUSEU|nr:unnamed protein product [Cuscuta europaea]